ncbi:50S ribosomal protein L32 [Rickettsiales bacterium (ex Bugula neritina AB1)]|nr:50S ribosomal protein L32 [Rickettsiales bacterium (ex Bugula neritina AB1)]
MSVVPKKKTSKSAKGMRKSHDALKETQGVLCNNCKNIIIPKNRCTKCGFYKNVFVKPPKNQYNDKKNLNN